MPGLQVNICTGKHPIERRRGEFRLSQRLRRTVVPIVANSVRIIATGLLYEFASSAVDHELSHRLAGYAMIAFAALLFWLVLWYLGKLFQEHEQMGVESLVRRMES